MYEFKDVYQYSKDLNVLYIEDDKYTRVENSTIFETMFKSVDTAVDGENGQDKYVEYKNSSGLYYDLVIADINMPKKNGIEMLEDIIILNPDQEAVMLTAYDDSFNLQSIIEQGVSGFIRKPIENDKLLKTFYKVCKSICNKKFQEEFIIEQSRLAQMGEMLNMIAHQWRQPLNAISASAINLSLKNSLNMIEDSDIEDITQIIQQKTQSLSEIIDDFMAFNKPESNKKFFLFEVVSHVEKIIAPQLKNRSIELEVKIDEGVEVFHNTKSIEHILLNLIINSRDAFEGKNIENKKIRVYLTEDENTLSLAVEDNAGGIPDEVLSKVFNPYFTTKEKGKGTGIGLYMSKQMMESVNNAQIDVKVKDCKTEFKLIFKK